MKEQKKKTKKSPYASFRIVGISNFSARMLMLTNVEHECGNFV